MTGKVLILGAKGRFGRAALNAFDKADWDIVTFARNWPDADAGRYERRTGNASDPEAVTKAATGCDVIINALNPPYPKWTRELPPLTASVIAAAKATGATIILPGNVYNYGADMPPILSEDTPHNPTSRKGMLREELEETYAIAGDKGVQTIILRGGDFIESETTGNWFDTYITPKIDQGKLTYPGPLDQVHAWAYLPDMARAAVGLAEKRQMLGTFSSFGFEGFNLTGAELVSEIEAISGRTLNVRSMPWPIMKALSVFMPTIREVLEMRYLWDVPHAIDGSKLASVRPEFIATPLRQALAEALSAKLGSVV